jgi:hypothetical protein
MKTTDLAPVSSPTEFQASIMASAITPELAHRRLAHAGQPKRKVNQNLLYEEIDGPENFDCEACRLRKSRQIISH